MRRAMILLLVLLTGLMPLAGAAEPGDGLVAYWTLDEPGAGDGRTDLVGDNDLVVIHNGSEGALSSAGVIGGATGFSYWPDHALLTALDLSDPALQFPDEPWTLAFWWRATGYDTSVILSKAGDLTIAHNTDRVHFSVNFDGNYLMTRDAPADHGWHFYVVWYDGADLFLQIDDGPVHSAAVTVTPSPDTGVFRLNPSGVGRGYVDELGKWDRVLTADERAALYNGGAGARPFD